MINMKINDITKKEKVTQPLKLPEKTFPESVKPAAAIRAANALSEAQLDPTVTIEHILVELSEGVGMQEILMQELYEKTAVEAVTRRLQIAILASHIIGVLQTLAMVQEKGVPEKIVQDILKELQGET